MKLEYVEKPANINNNSVQCLVVRQDLFDETVDAKRMNTKESKKRFLRF